MKIAIVTGASAGLGKETVIQLSKRFSALDEIWVIARRGERLAKLQAQVSTDLKLVPLDLASQEAHKRLKELLEKEQPEVKILVNAAGYGKIGEVLSVPLEEEMGMIGLNCQALCAVTKLVLPYMSKNSRIIQYASSAAFLPQPRFAIYAATKAFVLSYSRALNAELRSRKIFVTAVCPGPVKTEFFDVAETTGTMPLYKKLAMADPEQVVALALQDSIKGKSVSVYGRLMKAFRVLAKLMPHGVLLTLMTQIKGDNR